MTIGGGLNIHTIAELSSLLRAKDPLIPDLEKQYNAFHTTWTLTDPTSDASFKKDLENLKSRYALATLGLHTVIDAVPSFMANVTPAETQYQAVLNALQSQSGVVSPGDLEHLWIRLQNAVQANEAARGLPVTKLYEPPTSYIQPGKNDDWDENRIKDLNTIEALEKKFEKMLGVVLVVAGVAVIGIYVVPFLPVLARLLPKRQARA